MNQVIIETFKFNELSEQSNQTKYIYEYVVQGNYGYGWDDLTFHDKKYPESWRWAKDEMLLYSKEEKHALHRVIERRTLRNKESN